MAATYTQNIRLTKFATADRNWDVPIRDNYDLLDSLSPVGGLAVSTTETPSTTLAVAVAPGSFLCNNGMVVDYAGDSPVVIPASVVRHLWLSDNATLFQGAAWPSGTTPHVRLAVVTTDADSVTGIVDARVAVATSGPIAYHVTAVTAAHAVSDEDSVILADASGGAFAVTLPTAAGRADRAFTVKRINATNSVTVATTSSQMIDGATTYVLSAQWAAVTLVSDGTAWFVVNKV